MTARVLKQDPNTKRFKLKLIYFNTDTVKSANFRGNTLYPATKRHLNNLICHYFISILVIAKQLP